MLSNQKRKIYEKDQNFYPLDERDDGEDLTIMNTHYMRREKNPSGKGFYNDNLIVVYKDNKNGRKYYDIIEKPMYSFYLTTANTKLDHNYLFIDRDKTQRIDVSYADLKKEMSKYLSKEDKYQYEINLQNNDYSANNKLLNSNPRFFMSDMSIDDQTRFKFNLRFKNSVEKISKAFFDIEVDGRFSIGDFAKPGECPVNAIAFLNDSDNTLVQFLLRNPKNPLIQEYENEINSGKFTEKDMLNFIEDAVGGHKQMIRNKLTDLKVKVSFYDDEIQMMNDFFQMVHRKSPDFIEGWNSSGFDLPYLYARFNVLDCDPNEYMCDDRWPLKVVEHYVDERHLSEFAERGDHTFISGTTTWMDQMIQFCSRRKSKIGSFGSFKLDDIGYEVAHIHKLDYSDITNDVNMLAWLDYKRFSLYNMMDVIVQKGIETHCNDLEYIFAKCINNNTTYQKGHRQTVYLVNRMAREWYQLGYIIGNNINRWNEKPDKFLGALVHDPRKTGDFSKMKINNVPVLLLESLQDFDYKALYPSIILQFNIAPNTQIGKIVIPEKVYLNENAYRQDKYQRSGEYIENLVSDNVIEFSNRWLGLANTEEFLEDMQEYYKNEYVSYSNNGTYGRYVKDSNGIISIVPLYDSRRNKSVIHFGVDKINPLYFIDERKQ